MRTIKFRGKRVDNGEWVEGFLIGLYNPQIKENVIKQSFIHNGTIFYKPDEVIPETVGQFTGLNDKNGKEIYEGDILPMGTSVITRDGKTTTNQEFDVVKYVHGIYEPIAYFVSEVLEIIGNIHDNPELLGECK